MDLSNERAKPLTASGDASVSAPARRPRPSADKGHKIVFTITEADYQKIAFWCYKRGKRAEQVAEELLLAKFAE